MTANVYPSTSEADAPATANHGLAPYHRSRSGVRSSGAPTFTSSIDSSVTGLTYGYAYDNGVAAAVATDGKMPILIAIHGYNGTNSNITDIERFEACDAGWVVLNPKLRGHGGGAGSSDDSARELYDVAMDIVADFVASNPTLCDGTKIAVYGYSGGGASAVALAAKFPGRFMAVVSMFGWSDYGERGDAGSFWAISPGDRTTIETRIGTRGAFPTEAQMNAYRARNALANLGQSMLLQSVTLYLLWQSVDPIGALHLDTVEALRSADVPAERWYYEADTATADATVTVSGSTFTSTSHGLANGTRVFITSSSGLASVPAPLDGLTPYYVVSATANTLQLSATSGGSAITLTTAGAGTLKISNMKWVHGYVGAATNQVIEGSRIAQHYRDAFAPTVADIGEIVVTGFLVHPDFEVWLDDTGTTNPRINGTGGRKHVAHLRFDARTGTYWLTPLSGACKACVRQGGIDVLRELS